MNFNPFNELGIKPNDSFRNWDEIFPNSYDKDKTDPYTKTRIILANGAEFEGTWYKHNFLRHCDNQDLRREVSLTRRLEQQQQKELAVLKPVNESMLEHAISYEQLAIDLTAILAKHEKDSNIKQALDFALLEDFDHLYRFANLLELEKGIKSDKLVGRYTEITPGRPTISEHRYPFDNVKTFCDDKTSSILSRLTTMIITAAEQQTMNFYMNAASLYETDLGRKLFQEIGLIEEQHVTQYGSLLDPHCTWLEGLLMHEYTECYLYYSFVQEETDERIKKIWEKNLNEEIGHLHQATQLLEKYENKSYQDVLKTDGTFPELLKLGPNIDYIRDVLKNSVTLTSTLESYEEVSCVPKDSKFFELQKTLNGNSTIVPSHIVIKNHINELKEDYRFETAPNPVTELQNRTEDNIILGRNPGFNDKQECLNFYKN